MMAAHPSDRWNGERSMTRVGCLSRAMRARLVAAAAAALVVALGGAMASTAAGEVVVNAAPPNLTIAVTAVSGPDGNFGLAVEPGAGSVVVGQLAFGDPTITSANAVAGGAVLCAIDFFGNKVSCPLFPSTISIQAGDGDDRVQVGPSQGFSVQGCVLPGAGFTEPTITITANLGAGNDRLSVPDDPNRPDSPNPICPGAPSRTTPPAPSMRP
jgi:hypothetical protein